jgi:Helicase associated domain
MLLTLAMWPVDERIRLEQEMMRGAAYLNAARATGNVPAVAHPASQLSPHDFSMLQHLNANAQPPSQLLLPAFMGTDPLALLFNSTGMQNSMAAPVVTQPAFAMDVSRVPLGGGQETNERYSNLNASNRTFRSTLGAPVQSIGQQEQSNFAYAEFDACTEVDASATVHQVNGEPGLQMVNSETGTLSSLSSQRKISAAAKEKKAPDLKPPPKSKKRSAEDQPRKSKKKDSKWLTTLEELKIYKRESGNTIVPRGYSQNPRLASWVAEQRKQYKLLQDGKQSSITQERIDQLNEIDFAWNAQEAAWTRHLNDLRLFQAENGHCHVPLNHDKYPKLGLWVKEQRRHATLLKQGKPSHMTEQRSQELNSLGFCYDTHESTWMDRWRELAEFREQHGSCVVPSTHSNTKLVTWVHHQRRQFKRLRNGT